MVAVALLGLACGAGPAWATSARNWGRGKLSSPVVSCRYNIKGEVAAVPVEKNSSGKMAAHPSVRAVRARGDDVGYARETLEAAELRELCLEAGADDVGFASSLNPAVAIDHEDIQAALPGARSLISICVRTGREGVRSPMRSIANAEFHAGYEDAMSVAREVVRRLERRGIRALVPPSAFPQEMDRFGGKAWVVSHKLVAVATGLGQIGIHRNVIHPRFGSFILLGTVLLEPEITAYGAPLETNPCLGCNLCVAACLVGAIEADGPFDFVACYTHNYREFMSGFTDWVEQIVESTDAAEYRERVSNSETVSMWQSLSFKPNYKAAYCISVCPAGEDVLGPFLNDRKAHMRDVVRPLQRKAETVYVLPGSKAEAHVARRFPDKTARRVSNGFVPPPLVPENVERSRDESA
jgi:ferredoxin